MTIRAARLQFSLLSLALFTCFIGAVLGTYLLRERWTQKQSFSLPCYVRQMDSFNNAMISADGLYLFIANACKTGTEKRDAKQCFVFEIATGKCMATLDQKIYVVHMCQSNSGGLLAFSALTDGSEKEFSNVILCLWNWRNSTVLHYSHEYSLADGFCFSADDTALLTGEEANRRNGDVAMIKSIPVDASQNIVVTKLGADRSTILQSLDENQMTLYSGKNRVQLISVRDLKAPGVVKVAFDVNMASYSAITILPGSAECLAEAPDCKLARIDLKTGIVKWMSGAMNRNMMRVYSLSPNLESVAFFDPIGLKILDAQTGEPQSAPGGGTLKGKRMRYLKNGDLMLFEESSFDAGKNGTTQVHIYGRRFAEGWEGHLQRPELWLTAIFGASMLVRIIQRMRRLRKSGDNN